MPPCEISAVARKFLSDLKAEGEPVVGRNLIFTAGWLIGSTEVAESIGKGHGEQLLGLVAVDLSIDAEGNVVDCVMIEEFGTREGSSTTLCEDALKMNFEPLAIADANRTNRQVVQFSSVTLKAASVR
jgi:hypothetical protein